MTKGNRHGQQQGNARAIGRADTNPEGVTETQDKSRFLEIQRDLASGLLHCVGLPECLGLLLESSIQLPGFDCGGVYLCDEVDGALYLAAHCGLSADFVKRAARYDAESPQARLVFSGALTYAFQSDLPAELGEALAGEGLELLAMLPLHDRGRVVGSLNVASRHSSQIDRHSKIMLECLVSQAEGAIGQIKACEARRHAERQLRLAVEGAELGTWVADFETGIFEASSQARALHGISEEFTLNVMTAMEAIHPEDRQRVEEELRKSFSRGEPFSCEYRTCLETASAKWISS
jgi:PAS domain-containing protein